MDGADDVNAQAVGIIGIVPVMRERTIPGIEAIESAALKCFRIAGSNPEYPGLVLGFENGKHEVMAQAIPITGIVLVANKAFHMPIELIEPFGRPNPECPRLILEDGCDCAVTDACQVVRVVAKVRKGSRFTVKPVEASASIRCYHPEVFC